MREIVLLRTGFVLVLMFLAPGWSLLALTGVWQRWEGLQRWIVAIGVSIAFYPVLFYLVRPFSFLTLGPYKMGALLLTMSAYVLWCLRREWQQLLAFETFEWLAISVFALTIFTRFWIIRDYPYPAWSDSLHHTLLTQLTAEQGRLPLDMQPYFPVPLAMYHLGLYALSATFQWLGQVPAHAALLWVGQLLNGLCGLGVYLVLDRKVGRVGAIVGAVVVGLLSHQPAFYVNWGRFTQLASQTIMLIGWMVFWEGLCAWKHFGPAYRSERVGLVGLAALLSSAVFLLHFRVAAFYLPLLGLSYIWESRSRLPRRVYWAIGAFTGLLALVSLVLIAPALGEALGTYLRPRLVVTTVSNSIAGTYFTFPLSSFPLLIARPWLLILAGLAVGVGLWLRQRMTWLCLLWVGAALGMGYAYLLRIPALAFTNLGAVLIMVYLPIGLLLGTAVQALLRQLNPVLRVRVSEIILGFTLLAGAIGSHTSVQTIELYRHFITAADVQAMDWIKTHTAPESRFAVNTYFWLPRAPHGTDAGYWIPYFTGRQTTAGTMLSHLGTRAALEAIIADSVLVAQLNTSVQALRTLKAGGVDYIYLGARGNFAGPGLNAEELLAHDGCVCVYQNDGVVILYIEEEKP